MGSTVNGVNSGPLRMPNFESLPHQPASAAGRIVHPPEALDLGLRTYGYLQLRWYLRAVFQQRGHESHGRIHHVAEANRQVNLGYNGATGPHERLHDRRNGHDSRPSTSHSCRQSLHHKYQFSTAFRAPTDYGIRRFEPLLVNSAPSSWPALHDHQRARRHADAIYNISLLSTLATRATTRWCGSTAIPAR